MKRISLAKFSFFKHIVHVSAYDFKCSIYWLFQLRVFSAERYPCIVSIMEESKGSNFY